MRGEQDRHERHRRRGYGPFQDRHLQHERTHPLRVLRRREQAYVGSERQASEHRVVCAELVEQGERPASRSCRSGTRTRAWACRCVHGRADRAARRSSPARRGRRRYLGSAPRPATARACTRADVRPRRKRHRPARGPRGRSVRFGTARIAWRFLSHPIIYEHMLRTSGPKVRGLSDVDFAERVTATDAMPGATCGHSTRSTSTTGANARLTECTGCFGFSSGFRSRCSACWARRPRTLRRRSSSTSIRTT